MAPFQAKIGCKTQRKRENKNCHSIPFRSYPMLIENSKKIAKTFKKLKNTILAPFQAKIGCKTQRKRENKICHSIPFRSFPTHRIIENSIKIAKKFKKLKDTIMASFQAKIGR